MIRTKEQLVLSDDDKFKLLLKEAEDVGELGLDFGERILFAGSNGIMYYDLTSNEVVELAKDCAKNYNYVGVEKFHLNNLYPNPHHSKDKVDKFFLFQRALTEEMGSRFITVSKHQTSKRCSFCRELKVKYIRDRIFCCDNLECLFKVDRDINAGFNIRFDLHGWILYPELGALPSGAQKFKFIPPISVLEEKEKCKVCGKLANAQGLCQVHWDVAKKEGTLKNSTPCPEQILGQPCKRFGISGGPCKPCYKRQSRSGNLRPKLEGIVRLCANGCCKPFYGKGKGGEDLCHACYGREKRARKPGDKDYVKCKVLVCYRNVSSYDFCIDDYTSANNNGVDEFGMPERYRRVNIDSLK